MIDWLGSLNENDWFTIAIMSSLMAGMAWFFRYLLRSAQR